MTARADLNKQQILELAKRQWKIVEIAAHFQVAISTLYVYVTSPELAAAREAGRGAIREMYYERAKTSDRVLIHLVETQLGETAQQKRALIDVTNEELAAEVSRRVGVMKKVKEVGVEEALKLSEGAESEEGDGTAD